MAHGEAVKKQPSSIIEKKQIIVKKVPQNQTLKVHCS